MTAQPVVLPSAPAIEIDNDLREFLHLRETSTHYITQSFAGVTIEHPKAEIKYPWELLQGILAGGPDPIEALKSEREWERAHDAEKFG